MSHNDQLSNSWASMTCSRHAPPNSAHDRRRDAYRRLIQSFADHDSDITIIEEMAFMEPTIPNEFQSENLELPSADAPAPAPPRVSDECLSCMDAKPDTQMVPCGCRVICAECAIKVRRVLQKTCLQCHQEYTSITILIEKVHEDDNKGGRLAFSEIERLPHIEMPIETEHLGYIPLPKK